MKFVIITLAFVLASCTSVEFKASKPSESTTVITGYEKSLFDEKENLRLTISQLNGGQIQDIAWKGRKLLNAPIVEAFPNPDNDFKKQSIPDWETI